MDGIGHKIVVSLARRMHKINTRLESPQNQSMDSVFASQGGAPRTFGGGEVAVQQIPKTGSTLATINLGGGNTDNNSYEPGVSQQSQTHEIIRNGKVPEDSAAVWSITYHHLHEIVSPSARNRLFGRTKGLQVVPIIDVEPSKTTEKPTPRMYQLRDTSEMSVYSEYAGIDSRHLARYLLLSDEFNSYAKLSEDWSRKRWLASASYHFIFDLVTKSSFLENGQKLLITQEAFWQEFSRLNGHVCTNQLNLINKEVSRNDLLYEDLFVSSLKLIEYSRATCDILRQEYVRLKTIDPTCEWKTTLGDSVLATDVLLLLLHMCQTTTEQVTQWWFGVCHGHLHLANTVARFVDKKEDPNYPIKTTIIDFDRAKITAQQALASGELYDNLDFHSLKEKIFDESLHLSVRFNLLIYLPLSLWTDEIISFVESNATTRQFEQFFVHLKVKIPREITNASEYTWFVAFIHTHEKRLIPRYESPFFVATTECIKAKPELIEDSSYLSILALYHIHGDDLLRNSRIESLSIDQIYLLLSAISQGIRDIYDPHKLTEIELHFILDVSKNGGQIAPLAKEVLWIVLENPNELSTKEVSLKAINGNPESRQLFFELLNLFLADSEWRFRTALFSFLNKVLSNESIESVEVAQFIIGGIDLGRFNQVEVKQIYSNLTAMLDTKEAFAVFDRYPDLAEKMRPMVEGKFAGVIHHGVWQMLKMLIRNVRKKRGIQG